MTRAIVLLFFFTCSFAPAVLSAQERACLPPAPPASTAPNIFTEAQEVFLGDAIAEHLQNDVPVIDDDEITAYLRKIGDRLVQEVQPTALRFQFFLVELADANAFVLPGGRIYVSRKLVSVAQSEDELAGVMAHEMGHLIARQQTILMTRQLKDVVGITQVGDRQDVFAKYNQLVENAARRPGAFRVSEGHGNRDQLAADELGLFAAVRAGYDPNAQARLFERVSNTNAADGGFLSNLFGVTKPEVRRLQEMTRRAEALPKSCIRVAGGTDAAFQAWRAAVITYTGRSTRESLHGVVRSVVLDPPLRGEITHVRFSPDGRYVLAQDAAGIDVISREPFAFLFRIPAVGVNRAQFTPDSKEVIFHNPSLRVEIWSVAEQKIKNAHELILPNDCVQTTLAPNGAMISCFDARDTVSLFEVRSGNLIFEKKNFRITTELEVYALLLQALSAGAEMFPEDVGLMHMGFSEDGRYFAAGSRTVTQNSALILDTQTRELLPLKDPVKKLVATNFVFTGPDRLIAVNRDDVRKSALVSLPKLEVLQEFPMFPGRLSPAAKGNYVLVRPVQNHPVGVMDLAAGGVSTVSQTPAIDVYEQFLISERRSGELGIYALGKPEPLAALQLPNNDLVGLRGATLSENFGYLAMSDRSRASVWDLASGKQVLLTRGFRGSHVSSDGVLTADFPPFEKNGRQLLSMDVRQPKTGRAEALSESVLQYGEYLVDFKPARDRVYSENVTLEIRDVRARELLWSRRFPNEAPAVAVSYLSQTMILGWATTSRSAQAAIRSDSALQQRFRAMKDKEGDYLLEVIDARTGAHRAHVLIETGKGSFDIANAAAVKDWLIVTDTQNRVLLYSLETGEKKGQVFGSFAAVSESRGLVCIENQTGHLGIYDLATLRKRDEFVFTHGILMTRFAADGNRLVVIGTNQKAYFLDLSTVVP